MNDEYHVQLSDILGHKVYDINTADIHLNIDLFGLTSGIYFLSISDKKSKELYTKKVVIE